MVTARTASRPAAAVLLALASAAAALPAADPPGPAAPAAPSGVRVEKGITYATRGADALKLDIAVPKSAGPFPAVVLLHGGGWQGGDRKDLSRAGRDALGRPTPSVIETVAAGGYVVAAVSYRLAPKSKFPAQLDDTRSAIRFLRANAAEYGLDPARVGVVGFSAGGHLALLAGLADRPADPAPADLPDQSDRVRCVVSFFGPTDLSLYAVSPGIEDAYMVPLLGKGCRADPAVYRRASPIAHVSADDPPVLMIHGTADVIVPVIHSERLDAKLRAAGVTSELITVKGEGHGWDGPTAARTTREAVRFLDQHLKGKK